MSRLIRTLRSERLQPVLAGVVALALVAVVVVIATGGDDTAEPVAVPAAADRAEPAGGDDATDKAESESRQREQREKPKTEEEQPEPEDPAVAQPEPETPAVTGDGGEAQDDDSSRKAARETAEEVGISCEEQEKALEEGGGDPAFERFMRQWFGPCEK